MILNQHYKTDIKYVVGQSHVVLRILGIWPSTDKLPSLIEKTANILLVIICYFFLNCDMVPGALYYAVVNDESREKFKMMPPILYSIMAIGKYSNLLIHEEDIRSCFRHIEEDWRTIAVGDAREVMLSKAVVGRRLFVLCCTFMYCGGLSYNTVVPLSKGSIVVDENTTIRPLSCPGYYIFFNPQNSPAYELVYLQQVLCGFFMYTITVTMCGLAAVFAIHAYAQMEILIQMMKSLIDASGRQNVGTKLAVAIKHQVRLQNFLQLMENTLSYSNLVEITGCSVIICLCLYCIRLEWEDMNLVAMSSYAAALTSVVINIFILCYIGEYVTSQVISRYVISLEPVNVILINTYIYIYYLPHVSY
ncbi:uncharacterized protein [Cardiocondyla obscurior]|uniref:uncharacterized protein n=1 Tax=Cardiocondyla obscurior TaxID=286306 RepID=UPI00396588F0